MTHQCSVSVQTWLHNIGQPRLGPRTLTAQSPHVLGLYQVHISTVFKEPEGPSIGIVHNISSSLIYSCNTAYNLINKKSCSCRKLVTGFLLSPKMYLETLLYLLSFNSETNQCFLLFAGGFRAQWENRGKVFLQCKCF